MLFVKFKYQSRCFKIEVIFYCEQFVIRGYTGVNKNTDCLLQSTSYTDFSVSVTERHPLNFFVAFANIKHQRSMSSVTSPPASQQFIKSHER